MSGFNRVETGIEDLCLLKPEVYGDQRGFFMESYSMKAFEEIGIEAQFLQDNHSKSKAGVLRGIHFQKHHPQGKLVRVVAGSVYDVAVDLRPDSDTFGHWYGLILSAENRTMMYVPPGFGHGFLTLEDDTQFLYKTTDYYHPEDEGGILYDDPEIGIQWPKLDVEIVLSDKDRHLMTFEDYRCKLELSKEV